MSGDMEKSKGTSFGSYQFSDEDSLRNKKGSIQI